MAAKITIDSFVHDNYRINTSSHKGRWKYWWQNTHDISEKMNEFFRESVKR